MNFTSIQSWIAAVVPIMLIGCTQTVSDGPPEVRYGQTECAHCGMIVSEARFASAICASLEGEARELVYDDIRCMVLNERHVKMPTDARRYVHDFETSKWLKAEEARFIRDPQTMTPMGSGLLAFAPDSPRAVDGVPYSQIESLLKRDKPADHEPPATQSSDADHSHP